MRGKHRARRRSARNQNTPHFHETRTSTLLALRLVPLRAHRKIRKFVLYFPFQSFVLSVVKIMAIIRSSDIGTYLYCRRAWWYKKQGVESANQAELAAGTQIHIRHGRQVLASGITRTVGLILLMIALVMLVAYCTAKIV